MAVTNRWNRDTRHDEHLRTICISCEGVVGLSTKELLAQFEANCLPQCNESNRMETVSEVTQDVILQIENGLHLAPISRIVGELADFNAAVRVEFDNRSADARSATDLMLLAATCGAPLRVVADGADAEAAVQAVVSILENPEPAREPPARPR